MTLVKGGRSARPEVRSSPRPARRIAPFVFALTLAALVLGGCSGAFDKYFGTDKAPPSPPPADPKKQVSNVESTPEATSPPGEDKPYPNLGAVPQTRPVRQSIEEQRQAIAKGLVADRQNARYTDQVIRHEPVSATPPPRPVTAATQTAAQGQAKPASAPAASGVPKLPGAPPAPSPDPPAKDTAKGRTQVAQAPAAPPKPAVPALPSGTGARQSASPSAAPIPVAPPPSGQTSAVPPSYAPPPAAAATPPSATAAPPAAAPGRSNFTLGTAVAQAIEPPPQAADASEPPPQTTAPAPVAPSPAAGAARQAGLPSLPPASAQAQSSMMAQAPSVPPSAASPAAGGMGAASMYRPPPQVPPPPATMASVSQRGFQPPPPPLIPGQSPAPQTQSAQLPTQPPPPPGQKSPYPLGAQPVPQMAAVNPPPSSYSPPSSYQHPGYQQPGFQQPAYQQPAYQQPSYPPPQAAQPVNPYPAAQPAPSGRNPLRPPPPPISPALPAMGGGDPIAEARMRAAAAPSGQAAVAEARWRTGHTAGQQVGLILFQNGSAALGANDRDLLQRVATLARQSGGVVRVVGHASGRTGDMDVARNRSKNLDISLARANAAAGELRAAGLAADRIVVEAKGDSEPVYRETMPSGEAGNRRVDVYLQ